MSCVTSTSVTPFERSPWMWSMHFFWNSASPTAMTSSISRISGSTCTATAESEPEEHAGGVRAHRLVDEFADSENSIICGRTALASPSVRPSSTALRTAFSRPVICG